MLIGKIMQTTVRRMTLRRILKSHGITTYQEFRRRTGFSRQHAWNLWYGYTGVGKGTAKRLEELLGVPYDELMRVRPVPASKRYRKEPPSDDEESPEPPSEGEGK